MRKFNDKLFMETFLQKLKEKITQRKHPIMISLSKIALNSCRELKYAMWKNRDIMNKLLNDWWERLPKARDGRYKKILFNLDCNIYTGMGARFISIGLYNRHIHSMDILCLEIPPLKHKLDFNK